MRSIAEVREAGPAPIGHAAWLAPSVQAVAIEEDLVLLDLRTDAYFCLAGAAESVRLDARVRALAARDEALAADLSAAGLTVPVSRPAQIAQRPWPGPPRRSLLPRSTGPVGFSDLPEMRAGLWEVFLRYRGRSVRSLVALACAGPSRPDPTLTPALLDRVARFHRWISYAPVSGKCLLRAFLLLRLLRRDGHDALWVFGVSTWPFQAHCWLQVGDTVLDDTAERVGAYTPILVI